MKIIELQAENVKRLQAVEIKPNGNIVEIAGKNAQGKSSVLDAIAMALGGKRLCPARPVREGRDKASATVNLGEYVVKRTWTDGGANSYLSIETPQGATFKSPQKILDGLVGSLTFDPLAFIRLTPAEQRQRLLDLAPSLGADITKMAADEAEQMEQRREAKKDVARLRAQMDGMDVDESLRGKPSLDANKIVKQLEAADEHNEGLKELTSDQTRIQQELDAVTETVDDIQRSIDEKHRQIEALKNEIAEGENLKAGWIEEIGLQKQALKAATKKVNEFEVIDTSPFKAQLSTVSEHNAAVAALHQYEQIGKEVETLQQDIKDFDTEIADIRERRATLFSNADLPVDGLQFDDQGLVFNGLPFDQSSSAEQLRVAVAMGVAMNPKLKVLMIRDGSLLDDDSMAALREAVTEADFQLWIERVGKGGPGAVVIEDGNIKDAE